MISAYKIGQYIAQPHSVEGTDLADLAELVKKYPYCSSIQLLHLKGLALSNDIHFENQLKSTAIHAPDRAHLYELIHTVGLNVNDSKTDAENLKVAETVPPVELKEAVEINATVNSTKIKDSKYKLAIADETNLEVASETAIDVKENIVEKTVAEIPKISAESKEKSEVKTSEAPNNDVSSEIESENSDLNQEEANADLLEVDILTNVIDIAYVTSGIEEKNLEVKDELTAPEKEVVGLNQNFVETENSSTKWNTNKEFSKKDLPEQKTKELSFIEWLRLKQKNKDVSVETDNSITDSKNTNEKQIPTEIGTKRTKKNTIDALLEKFIKEEPRISKPVKDFYNPVKNAQKSVEESSNIISETLAEIHVLQKNYSKAISAYERLILLYPEKKTFFASRITKIKEEIKKR